MAIVKPEQLDFSGKKFSMLIYGLPGVGKTTLALSAPKPLLLDFDRGISRVKANHRTASVQSATYEEVLNDLRSPEAKEFETIVVDTGGSFITFLQDWAIRTNPAQNQQKNGAISLKGFGAVKQEFIRFTNFVKDTLNKNLIYVFHSDEQKDKDGNPMQRIVAEGAAKNLVWMPCDFGGYIQMIGDERKISFTPSQEFNAKGSFGIEGTYNIPSITNNDKNVFLTTLFDLARHNIDEESKKEAPDKAQYEAIMAEVSAIVDAITTAEEATQAASYIPTLEHVLTSKKESSALLNQKCKKLGLKWDKTQKKYLPAIPA